MQIRQLLDGVRNKEMVMPEFQREYVWNKEQAKQLMISLFKEYPTGSLLFWETSEPPEIKNDALARERIGLTKVILDGQQRLTTLYLMITNEIPPYYTIDDLNNDPRDLYFNVKDGEFGYYMRTKMENDPFWIKVTDCFKGDFDAFTLVEKLSIENSDEKLKLGQQINNNLNNLRKINDLDYPIQTVPTGATIDEAIDVFDRVNSKGTKLTDAELVLTHITGKWSESRRKIKEKKMMLEKENFDFDLDFLTRCLVVALTGSALFKSVNYNKYQKQDYIDAWGKVSKIFDYLIPVLRQNAYISGTNDLSTNNVLVPIIAFLLKNDGKFPQNYKYGFIYWMYLALIWGRYSGQTDQRLEKDVYLSKNSENPIKNLVAEIEDQRGRINVKAVDLEGRGAGNPIYRMLYILSKYNKAIDWSSGGSVYDTLGDYYSIHSHHIFPQALLYRSGYDADNHLDKKKVNEIANRAFITRDTNFEISDKNPHEYLKKVIKQYPEALSQQLIPNNSELWKIENFEKFLIERREMIANAVNEFLEEIKKLSFTSEEIKETNWNKIIENGENDFVEFKSSLRWSYKEEKLNKKLEYVVAKTISAFLNSEGGTLFIGVNDDGEILGLDKDFQTLKSQNKDGFLLQLTQIINSYLGKELHQYISIKIEEIQDNNMAIIEVSNSLSPVYIKNEGKEEFFIRASASSQPLNISEFAEYKKSHWN